MTNFTTPNKDNENFMQSHRKCALPQYISLSAAFAFITVSVFLRLVFLYLPNSLGYFYLFDLPGYQFLSNQFLSY